MAATKSKKAATATVPGLSIRTAKGVTSFLRAGMAFSDSPKVVALEDLTDAQIAALKAEKRLCVTEVEDIGSAASDSDGTAAGDSADTSGTAEGNSADASTTSGAE